jgi:hypothetical protein
LLLPLIFESWPNTGQRRDLNQFESREKCLPVPTSDYKSQS